MSKRFVMVAGPNGAGKSSFYELFLSDLGLPFVNADLIAESVGLEPYDAARAAALVRERFVHLGASFIAETVFSDPVGDKLQLLRDATNAGFEVTLVYIGLESVPLAQARVSARVANGGHDVPDEKISARYPRSLLNLKAAIPIVPDVRVHENSSVADPYRFLAAFENGALVRRVKGRLPSWTRGLFPVTRVARKGKKSG